MANMTLWVLLKDMQPLATRLNSRLHILKNTAMSRNDQTWRQLFYEIQRRRGGFEPVLAAKLGEDDGKPILPQCIASDQNAGLRFEQQNRVRIVAGSSMDLPSGWAERELITCVQGSVHSKSLA